MTKIYLIFLTFTLVFSFIVIVSRNPIYSVFCLIFVFLNTTFILFLFNIEFLGLILLIIYAGAVSVLFLFVVLLLNVKTESKELNISFLTLLFTFKFTYSLIFSISGFFKEMETLYKIINTDVLNLTIKMYKTNFDINFLGTATYTHFFILFFLCTIILLVAMIGALTLTKR